MCKGNETAEDRSDNRAEDESSKSDQKGGSTEKKCGCKFHPAFGA